MPAAAKIIFNFKDGKGKSASTSMRVPNSFTVAQMLEFAAAAAQVVKNISGGILVDVSLSIPMDLSGATIRAVASTIADVWQKGLFIVASGVAGLFARFNIPTWDEAKVLTGTNQIDLEDEDVEALTNALDNGLVISGTTVTPRTLRGNLLDDVTSAVKTFLKS